MTAALTLAEVGARLGVSTSTVSRLIDQGRLTRLAGMRCVRVTQASLDAYLGQKSVDSENPWDVTLANAHAN